MSGWKVIVHLPDTPEDELRHAVQAVKQLLEPSFGHVTSTTIRADQFEAHLRPAPPFRERHSGLGVAEHVVTTSSNGHRRRRGARNGG